MDLRSRIRTDGDNGREEIINFLRAQILNRPPEKRFYSSVVTAAPTISHDPDDIRTTCLLFRERREVVNPLGTIGNGWVTQWIFCRRRAPFSGIICIYFLRSAYAKTEMRIRLVRKSVFRRRKMSIRSAAAPVYTYSPVYLNCGGRGGYVLIR